MTTSYWLPGLGYTTASHSADIVIVGAGFVGLSTAYWLSEFHPQAKIVVLDRSFLGSGASGRNAGFLTKGSATFYQSLQKKWGIDKAHSLFQYAEESLQLLHQKILKSCPEISFEASRSLTLVQEKWDTTSSLPEKFKFTWKSQAEIGKSLGSNFFGAYESQQEFKVNPWELLTTLKRILSERKISVIENLSAFELTSDGVVTETGLIKCRKVVLALNGYFPRFHSSFKSVIKSQRAQMLAVKLESEIDSEALHYDSPERVYWRKVDQETLLIGGKRLLDAENEAEDFEKINPLIQSGLESYLKDSLKVKFKVIKRWSGIMGFTEHELPFLTKVDAPLEAFAVGGFSGHGMGLGFKAAQEMAELVTGKISKSILDQYKTVEIKL